MGSPNGFNFLNFLASCQWLNQLLPFAGDTLRQIGPPPNFWAFFSNQGGWQNQNWGMTMDGYYPSVGATSSSSKSDKVEQPAKTDEEKLEEKKKQKQEAREKEEAIESYKTTRTIIENYNTTLKKQLETLPEGEEKTKLQGLVDELESTLEIYKEITSNTKETKEKILEKQKGLQALIDKHKDVLKEYSIATHLKNACLELPKDYDKHKKFANALTSGSDENYGGVLKGDTAKSWNDDVDLIQLVSAWKPAENSNTSFIMAVLNGKGDHKGALIREMHNEIINIAEDLQNKTIPSDLKSVMQSDIDILKSYHPDTDTECKIIEGNKTAYSKAFNNLYQAIRTAKAELAQSELNKDLEAIGALEESDKEAILTKNTQSLKSLGIERAYDIEEYSAGKPTIGTGTGTGTGTTVSGSGTIPGSSTTSTNYTNKEIIDFFNISDDTKKEGDGSRTAWIDYGHKLADLLIGYTSVGSNGDLPQIVDIIYNKIDAKNVFTVLAGYEDNDAGGHNIIEQLYFEHLNDGEYKYSEDNVINFSKSDCIAQILRMAVANLKAQVDNPDLNKDQVTSDYKALEQYISITATLEEDDCEKIDDILHRYSNIIDDKLEYDGD